MQMVRLCPSRSGLNWLEAVAEAIMQQLGCDQSVYCQSFPANGRTAFQGHMFVGEDLLSDSPMSALSDA